MSAATVVFPPTGTIQTYFVPTAGTYVIEAAGAQGGAGAGPGGKGARVSGMFYLCALGVPLRFLWLPPGNEELPRRKEN